MSSRDKDGQDPGLGVCGVMAVCVSALACFWALRGCVCAHMYITSQSLVAQITKAPSPEIRLGRAEGKLAVLSQPVPPLLQPGALSLASVQTTPLPSHPLTLLSVASLTS